MVLSYSGLTLYERCSQAFKLRYIDKVEGGTSHAAKLGNVVHRAISMHIRGLNPDEIKNVLMSIPDYQEAEKLYERAKDAYIRIINTISDPSAVVATEMKFGISPDKGVVGFRSPDAVFRGIIDLVVISDVGIHIYDFKTGYGAPDPRQLLLYGYVVEHGYKERLSRIYGSPDALPITMLGFIDLRRDETVRIDFEPSDFDAVWNWARGLIERIQSEKDFKPQAGEHCSYCFYKYACELAQEQKQPTDPAAALTLAQYYKAVARELEKMAKEYVKENGQLELPDGSVYVKSETEVYRVQDKDAVFNTILKRSPDPVRFIKFDNPAVAEAFPSLIEQGAMKKTYKTTFQIVKKEEKQNGGKENA